MAAAIGYELPVREESSAGLPSVFARALSQSFVAFQPIVSYADRRVFGFEALVRSRAGLLSSAAELVGAAESLGSLFSLGRAVRGAVAREMPRAPEGSVLFVNLHPHDLLDPDLASPDAPLSRVAHRVVLEITERAAAARGAELRDRLDALRRLGFRVAVDDLGAGFSSLDLLADLHPDFVKLDMSLVRRVDRDDARRRIVGHLLRLLGDLGAGAVAEGVETPGERDALLALGAPLLQGYLFGLPGPDLVTPSW
jgi:EAL domain-containing protein (putative c-di-GMP-specific phosphodiesterase class I)